MALANDIDDAFVKQFESDVHLAYQRMGAKLVPTVRTKTAVSYTHLPLPPTPYE